MQTSRTNTLATAAAVALCCLTPPSVSDAFMIPTSAAAGRGPPLSARTKHSRRPASFDNTRHAPRISAAVGSSKPLAAKPASTPETATPPAATKDAPAASPSAEGVPSSAGGEKTCDSRSSSVEGSAPTFSYRKTFWQPFLPPEKNGAEPAPRSTTGGLGSPESSTPANEPPTFLYRKTFWQPFAGAASTAADAVGEATAAAVDAAAAAAATAAAPVIEESAASPAAGPETTGDARGGAAPASTNRKTFWQPFLPPEKGSSPAGSVTGSSAAAAAAAGRGSSNPSTPANDPPTFLYRRAFRQPFTGVASAAAAAVGAGSSPTDSAKGVEPSSTAPPSAGETAAPETTSAATSPSAAGGGSAAAGSASAEPEAAGGEESAAQLPPTSAADEVPPPPAAKAGSAPPPPVSFEPDPVLISDSPMYQDAALNLKRAKEAFAPFTKKIQDNVAEGNVGERGEEWAIAQGVIIFFIGMGSVPVIGGLVMLLAGPGLVAAGAGVIAAGAKGLGKSLSPWPAPVEDNKLNTDGIYGMMRHPMYTGVVMLTLGFGVLTDSPLRMLLAVTLALVLDKKAAKEEEMLLGLHGESYADYLKAVAKFVPRLY